MERTAPEEYVSIPFKGTEEIRALLEAGGRFFPFEIITTTDQQRMFVVNEAKQCVLISKGKWQGAVADEAAMLALNSASVFGCWPGDKCERTDEDAAVFECIANNGALLADWKLYAGGGGGEGDMTGAEIIAAIQTVSGAGRLNYSTDLKNLPTIPTAETAVTIRDKINTLEGADRMDYGVVLKNLPTIPPALAPATDVALGGIKVGTGLEVTLDGTLSVSAAAIGMLIGFTFMSLDNFDDYTTGITGPLGFGFSWAADSTWTELADPLLNVADFDTFDSYASGSGSADGGHGWGVGSEWLSPADPLLLVSDFDDFNSYATGTGSAAGGHGWGVGSQWLAVTPV